MEQTARYILIAAILWCATSAVAGPFDPPANYYDTATGTGATLQSQLHDIIDNHTVLSYDSARANLQVTDVDPINPENIILVYDRVLLDISALISGVGIPGWDSGVSWNREHTWPRSRGVDTLDKLGSDGTYYEVTTAGDATSTLSGRYNAFSTGGTDSATFDVVLNTSTATAGQQSGTVTIDNLDVTTGGGVGLGDNDGDDVLTVILDVLDHAIPSFAGDTELTTLTLDFGQVLRNSPFPTLDFDVFNLEATPGFTADLRLTGTPMSGDYQVLTTNYADVAAQGNVAPGESTTVTATLETNGLGTFAATYFLNFLDEDIPGPFNFTLITLNLIGEVVAADADLDVDGDVDGRDFLLLHRDGGVDVAVWESQFGTTGGSVVAVPEPTAVDIVIIGLLVYAAHVTRGWLRQ